jgi:hypothetical protein
MTDTSLFTFRSGIREVKRKLGDGQEHTLYFRAKTPSELALFMGAEKRYPETDAGDILRETTRAEFIATSLCDEAGELLFRSKGEKGNEKPDPQLIPPLMKLELSFMIMQESNRSDAAVGKG